jgi:two-component system, response regulator
VESLVFVGEGTLEKNTVLLVEDNPTDARLVERAFHKNGVPAELIVASDGQQALNLLFGENMQQPIQKPKLILLDIKLPKVDGLQVLERIRSEDATSLTPVVMLTSSDEMRDINKAYRLGANSYVRKLEDIDLYMEHLTNIGQYWLMANVGFTHI